jgi:hypothetical protein
MTRQRTPPSAVIRADAQRVSAYWKHVAAFHE